MRISDEKLEELANQVDKWQQRVNLLTRERDRLQRDLSCFDFQGYDRYQKQFLEAERIRIAVECMERIDPEDSRGRLLAQGQYNQVKRQLRIKEDLLVELDRNDAEQKAARSRLEKAQKQYERIRNHA